MFPRRDGTVKYNRRDFLDGTGRYESTVGKIVDGTGQDGTTVSFWRRFYRLVPSCIYRQYGPVNKPWQALKITLYVAILPTHRGRGDLLTDAIFSLFCRVVCSPTLGKVRPCTRYTNHPCWVAANVNRDLAQDPCLIKKKQRLDHALFLLSAGSGHWRCCYRYNPRSVRAGASLCAKKKDKVEILAFSQSTAGPK